MVHITEYEFFHEQGYYAPGDTGVPVYDTRFGRIGVAICYDRHYPEYMRALAIQGADVVFIPQAGSEGEWPEGLYEAELRACARITSDSLGPGLGQIWFGRLSETTGVAWLRRGFRD